jgi:ankyrin repeat protein
VRWLLPIAFYFALSGSSYAGELYDAVLANNVEEVRRLVAGAANLEEAGDLGPPLHVAVFQGNVAMAVLLLDKGANIESARDINGYHPLHVAVSYNQPDMVAALLKRGANVEARDNQDRTALLMAARENYLAVGKVLLENGADVNARSGSSQFTPLYATAYGDNPAFAKLLLTYKADVNALADGTTPLLKAASQGSPELIEVLIANGADVNARDKAGVTALTLSFGNIHKESSEVLRKHGAKP